MIPSAIKVLLKKYLGFERNETLARVRLVFTDKYFLLKTGCFRNKFDIVFYCEQPSHWQNISSVVELCLRRFSSKQLLLLTSYDKSDYPDVLYPDWLKVVCGVRQSLLTHIQTKLLYTPFVGLTKRCKPKNAIVAHTLVSLTSLDGVYRADMFDEYDYIFCAGKHHFSDFIRWASLNPNLHGKVLVPAGYPKLDLVLKEKFETPNLDADVYTVVYAPTHVYSVNESLASLRQYGQDIVELLLKSGCRVIFRPHPVSFRDQDKDLVSKIIQSHSGNPMFTVDRSKNYTESYSKANLMVTDLSGTGFTYSLSFLRPSVFFCCNPDSEAGLHGIQFEDREKIGAVARSLDELADLVTQLRYSDISGIIIEYRAKQFFNVGSSAEYIVNNMDLILSNGLQPDWLKI